MFITSLALLSNCEYSQIWRKIPHNSSILTRNMNLPSEIFRKSNTLKPIFIAWFYLRRGEYNLSSSGYYSLADVVLLCFLEHVYIFLTNISSCSTYIIEELLFINSTCMKIWTFLKELYTKHLSLRGHEIYIISVSPYYKYSFLSKRYLTNLNRRIESY